MFPQVWKVAVMFVMEAILVYVGLLFFILPGLFLCFAGAWLLRLMSTRIRPVRCLKQAPVMVGEIKNLLKWRQLFYQYLFAALYGISAVSLINLFKCLHLQWLFRFYNGLYY
jgi:hypothetical protein